MNKKVIILLAQGFEEIEAVTCIDLLRRAQIKVSIASISKLIVSGSRNLKIKADQKINNSNGSYDACILPGGMPGAKNLASSKEAIELIKKMNKEKKLIAAICASPAIVLSPLGLLNNKNATCYPGMKNKLSSLTHYENKPVVSDKNITTSQGPATAFAFAFRIIKLLLDEKTSQEIKKATLYSN